MAVPMLNRLFVGCAATPALNWWNEFAVGNTGAVVGAVGGPPPKLNAEVVAVSPPKLNAEAAAGAVGGPPPNANALLAAGDANEEGALAGD